MRELNRDEINKVSGGWDFSSGITTSTPSNFSLGSGSYSHDYNGYSGTSNHSYSWGGANKTQVFATNSPALVGAGFGNGAYSSAFYNKRTNKKSPINEAIINGINKASDFLGDFNKAVSGSPTR